MVPGYQESDGSGVRKKQQRAKPYLRSRMPLNSCEALDMGIHNLESCALGLALYAFQGWANVEVAGKWTCYSLPACEKVFWYTEHTKNIYFVRCISAIDLHYAYTIYDQRQEHLQGGRKNQL